MVAPIRETTAATTLKTLTPTATLWAVNRLESSRDIVFSRIGVGSILREREIRSIGRSGGRIDSI
jgi:hypothetical protein